MKLKRGLRAFTVFAILSILAGIFPSCAGDDSPDDFLLTEEMLKNAELMRGFVKDISACAREKKPGFIIIPQNAPELAFRNTNFSEGIDPSFASAVDGIGNESLFYSYSGRLDIDNERLEMLRVLKKRIAVMVSDYVLNGEGFSGSERFCRAEGFIAFPRSRDNFHYMEIPALKGANRKDITSLAAAENYLYLISTDTFAGKEEMINAIASTNYDLVLMDLFFDSVPFTKEEILRLKTKASGGKRLVVSYINIGSAETYRYYWKDEWKKGNPAWLIKEYPGFPDEYWVDFRDPEWRNIIFGNDSSYIQKIIDAGFDGAYLDNVEAYRSAFE